MQFDLFDFQREAAANVLKRLVQAGEDWRDDGDRSAFALSAVTGAGKTVIATAVIEGVLFGSADLGVDPDPRATFLWVTDDPALNRQTRNKMLAASDLLTPSQLVILGNDHLEPTLAAGKVYFLNVQQLSRKSGFANRATLRQQTGWEVIGNTIAAEDRDLYVILDEAHRGMKQASDRKTIVRRIIGGEPGSNPPAPVVWGISATPQRFSTAMKEHENDRTMRPTIAVDIEKVRASGLVKDQIDLEEPDEAGTFTTTLLTLAVQSALDFEKRWSAYSSSESEPEVLPVLVVQVPDKVTDADLGERVAVIEQGWSGLGPNAIVNVFGEHDDVVVGNRTVRWVRPESIEDDTSIRVVLAKEAISTGWDCPRAEVLYSERPASDATHIAQVIGRMVRSPLAHRIATDDALNAVTCFLPRFNRKALTEVINELTEPGDPQTAAEVVVHSHVFERNPTLDADVFDVVEDVPSWPKPDKLASPLRRAKAMAKLLTDGSSGTPMLADAGERLTKALNARLDGLMAEHADAVDTNVEDLLTLRSRTIRVGTTDGTVLEETTRTLATSPGDLARDTQREINKVKEGVAKDYVRHLVDKGGDAADVLGIKTRVAALLRVDGTVAEVEAAATTWVLDQFVTFDVGIKNSTGATKDAFLRVKEQSSAQEETGIELPLTLRAPTRSSNAEDADDLPRLAGHLFADADGTFPVKLNGLETKVMAREMAEGSFVAWYRNPSRASVSAHRIGYRRDADTWESLQVDFLVVSRRGDGTLRVSIVDPHGDFLADAKAKLSGLARFAEEFGDRFVRIESIVELPDGTMRLLDLQAETVRDAIDAYEESHVRALYESDIATTYA
jgi:hypothetical protein